MSVDIHEVVNSWHARQPHPLEPRLKVGEFATAVKLATKAKFGGHASAQEAGAFWTEFKSMNDSLTAQKKLPLSPEEFGQVLDRLAPNSFGFHGRPPTMAEIVRHRDADPAAIQKYYADLPDKHYPTVTAGEMARYLQISHDHAIETLGRPPNKLEASRFALSKASADDIRGYYINAVQEPTGPSLGIQRLAPRFPGGVPEEGFRWRPGRGGEPAAGVRGPGANAPEGRLGGRPAPEPWGAPPPANEAPESGGQEAGLTA